MHFGLQHYKAIGWHLIKHSRRHIFGQQEFIIYLVVASIIIILIWKSLLFSATSQEIISHIFLYVVHVKIGFHQVNTLLYMLSSYLL